MNYLKIESMGIISIIFLICSSCTSATNTNPLNSSDLTSQTIQQEFLIGQGTGSHPSEADENAFTDISKYFSSIISASQEIHDTQDMTTNDSSVNIQTNSLLKGVEIVDRWEKSGIYYAKAVIKKSSATSLFKKMMSKQDAEDLATYKRCCKQFNIQEDDPFKIILEINALKQRREQREQINDQYMVLSHATFANPLSKEKLIETHQQITKEIDIYIELSSLTPRLMLTKLQATLNKLNLKRTEHYEQATHFINLEMTPKKQEKTLKGWFFTTSTISISLKNKQNKILNQFSDEYTASALTEEASLNNSIDVLLQRWVNQFSPQSITP